MATDTDIESAHAEMDYVTGTGSFGQDTSVAIPCQLRFEDGASRDLDRFHDVLDEHGFSPLDADPGWHRSDPDRYEGEVMVKENYKRINVLVFRGGTVRIFPREDQPTVDELGDLIDALEGGYGATLFHDPIEREGGDGE